MITILYKKTNELGIFSSILCMIHCMATPFLLVAIPSSSIIYQRGQLWWSWLDVLFLIISLIAVFVAVQQSKQKWVQISMIVSWFLLSFFVINERLEGIEFSFDMVYFPAFALTVFHVINIRHCRCEEGCCEKDMPVG